eukprot:g33890.t1
MVLKTGDTVPVVVAWLQAMSEPGYQLVEVVVFELQQCVSIYNNSVPPQIRSYADVSGMRPKPKTFWPQSKGIGAVEGLEGAGKGVLVN